METHPTQVVPQGGVSNWGNQAYLLACLQQHREAVGELGDRRCSGRGQDTRLERSLPSSPEGPHGSGRGQALLCDGSTRSQRPCRGKQSPNLPAAWTSRDSDPTEPEGHFQHPGMAETPWDGAGACTTAGESCLLHTQPLSWGHRNVVTNGTEMRPSCPHGGGHFWRPSKAGHGSSSCLCLIP